MSIKNRLESVIRGWFPKEPSIPRGKLKMAENRKTGVTYVSFRPFFFVIGLIGMVIGIATISWDLTIMTATFVLAFFPNVLLKRFTLQIVHRLCFFPLGLVAYYYHSSNIFSALYLLVGIIGLIDAIRLIIKRNA